MKNPVDKQKFPYTLDNMRHFSPFSEKRLVQMNKTAEKFMLNSMERIAEIENEKSKEKVDLLESKNKAIEQWLRMYERFLIMKMSSLDAVIWVSQMSEEQINLINARLAHGQTIRKLKNKKISFRDVLGLTHEDKEAKEKE